MPLFKIESMSCFRNTYVVEAEDAERASDIFLMADLDYLEPPTEVDQKHVGTLNFMVDEINRSDFDKLLDAGCNGHLGDKLIVKKTVGDAYDEKAV